MPSLVTHLYLGTLRCIKEHAGRPGTYDAEALRRLSLRGWAERRAGSLEGRPAWFLTLKGEEALAGLRKPAKHPCQGLPLVQVNAFEAIATNQGTRAAPKTILALRDAGLIYQSGNEVMGSDRFGMISVPRWDVPPDVHAQWCQWCAENVDEPDETEPVANR